MSLPKLTLVAMCLALYACTTTPSTDSPPALLMKQPRELQKAPSDARLSGVAETVISNYAACSANTEQLKALQEYIRKGNAQ